ncbi:response regulator transcription factor [Streptomyces sp. NPDC007369]|uniref:response regulator transcription factor n=1 Tax=Streptomyces sp. NPDC007369 TaxID=3154589 RepID=UPI00340F42CE
MLVVEDELATADALISSLQRHGYETEQATTGREALAIHGDADFILLDLGLPDMDGLEVCRAIRQVTDTPIIATTDGRSELDRVLGLQAGADDCLDKPYGLRELIARIQAVTRRTHTKPKPADTIVRGQLEIAVSSRQVRLAGRQANLTRKEFDLLVALASRPGVVLTRKELMAQVWDDGWSMGRTIDTHVNGLRTKLGCNSWIVTVRGVGFRFGTGPGAAAQE